MYAKRVWRQSTRKSFKCREAIQVRESCQWALWRHNNRITATLCILRDAYSILEASHQRRNAVTSSSFDQTNNHRIFHQTKRVSNTTKLTTLGTACEDWLPIFLLFFLIGHTKQDTYYQQVKQTRSRGTITICPTRNPKVHWKKRKNISFRFGHQTWQSHLRRSHQSVAVATENTFPFSLWDSLF